MSKPKKTAKPKRTPVPQGVRFEVFQRDRFACVYCGAASSETVVLHCDHVTAVANGGGNEMSNLVTACSDCNYGKGAKRLTTRPTMRQHAANGGSGLSGTFGHMKDDAGHIQKQFRIVGPVGQGAHSVELFSFLDGGPTGIEIIATDDLAGPGYALYSTEHAFKMAYWREREARGLLRNNTAEQAYERGEWFNRVMSGAAA